MLSESVSTCLVGMTVTLPPEPIATSPYQIHLVDAIKTAVSLQGLVAR